MVERNAGVPLDRRIEFRIGIHLGDVVEESDGDLMGDAERGAAPIGLTRAMASANGLWHGRIVPKSGRDRRKSMRRISFRPIAPIEPGALYVQVARQAVASAAF
jgi:hypothetical protein